MTSTRSFHPHFDDIHLPLQVKSLFWKGEHFQGTKKGISIRDVFRAHSSI